MYFLLVLCIAIGVCAHLQLKKWYNPITVFSYMWALIFFLHSLRLVDYWEISFETLIVLFLQMFGFAVGGFVGCNSQLKIRIKGIDIQDRTEFRIKWFYILAAITIYVLLSDAREVIKGLQAGMSFDDIENEGLIMENEATGLMVLVKMFIVFPMTHCVSAIGAGELFFGKGKHRWPVIIISVAIVVLYSLQHGARYTLILFVTSCIVAFAMSGKQGSISKIARIFVILGCVMAALFAFWLSASRGIEDVWMSLYKYFAGIPALLNRWIETINSSDAMTYGATATWGFTYPFLTLLRGVGVIKKVPDVIQTATTFIFAPENPVSIGNSAGLNAHIGPAYAFFCDGRFVFVLIGMFFYGYICARAYKRAISEEESKSKSRYLFWISIVVYSFVRFPFTSYMFGMALLVQKLLYSGKKGDKL